MMSSDVGSSPVGFLRGAQRECLSDMHRNDAAMVLAEFELHRVTGMQIRNLHRVVNIVRMKEQLFCGIHLDKTKLIPQTTDEPMKPSLVVPTKVCDKLLSGGVDATGRETIRRSWKLAARPRGSDAIFHVVEQNE